MAIDHERADQVLKLLEAMVEADQQLLGFRPYAKQAEFLALGATKHERLLIAGNQNGKSICGALTSGVVTRPQGDCCSSH